MSDFTSVSATGLMDAWEERVKDPRPRVATGWPGLDGNLHRGGFSPGELVILGGRTHTRKTTVALNMMAQMLSAGVAVGFVALDEATHSYAAKLTSIFTGLPHQDLEDRWDETRDVRLEASQKMTGLSVTRGARPSFDALSYWLTETCAIDLGRIPQVVFIDYISLLGRDKFAGGEMQRVQRLIEELQVWTSTHEVVTIALHQVGRMDEGQGKRYHGDTPLSPESLKYGGEEIADVVLGTYRPSNEPVGNMSAAEAKAALGDKYDEDEWSDARSRVEQYRDITFLQLLKNRPGVELDYRGLMLRSPSKSLAMVPAAAEAVDDKVVNLHG